MTLQAGDREYPLFPYPVHMHQALGIDLEISHLSSESLDRNVEAIFRLVPGLTRVRGHVEIVEQIAAAMPLAGVPGMSANGIVNWIGDHLKFLGYVVHRDPPAWWSGAR
ncbi:MAG: hypothetical protein WC551_07500 [Patescibacteria group bacterium]